METILIKALQLILSLSILVVVHEFGHFLFARIFKIRVEKFYLFFNPWFSLFKFKPKNSETEYGIGWLPLGGYVKISGMIDESMDKEQMAQPPQPWEFRSKPAWQRLLVMVGGVLFNFILAIFIFAMMLFAWGDSYIPFKAVKTGMEFPAVAKEAGFQDKDILISADGEELAHRGGIVYMNTVMRFIDAKEVVVERDGKEVTITLPEDFADKAIADKEVPPYSFWVSPVVDSVIANSGAGKIGLTKGDSIVAVNNVAVKSNGQAIREFKKANKDSLVQVSFYRDTTLITTAAKLDSTGALGYYPKLDLASLIKKDEYGFFASLPAGAALGVNTLKGYVAQARFVFSKQGVKQLSGFAGIGNMFPPVWDWHAFWAMTAFLSIILAFMNILPIPALDGGHIMFLLYEVITRRQPGMKFMEYAQIAGMLFILLLLIVANGNDILRIFFK
ncbi:MAG: RIP metalloprotease RseP [Prevotella sp.]|jgi:regulator of sigma E protease|nr:RIP metalloprotease RseP [Prevotella sp.]